MRLMTFLSGAGIGACLMYWFDPQQGNRRRALLRDQLRSSAREMDHNTRQRLRDLRNRARGLVCETAGSLEADDVSDEVLTQRVRSAMGHVVSHPGSIDVAVCDGEATLSGAIGGTEVQSLVKTVAAVRGVRRVDNRLQVQTAKPSSPAGST